MATQDKPKTGILQVKFTDYMSGFKFGLGFMTAIVVWITVISPVLCIGLFLFLRSVERFLTDLGAIGG